MISIEEKEFKATKCILNFGHTLECIAELVSKFENLESKITQTNIDQNKNYDKEAIDYKINDL